MSCEYCHEDRDGYTNPLDKNAHVWIQYPNKLVTHFGGILRKYEINFCPMCGRKLEVANDA
jgi:hypothetical protein